jgi:thymidine phosphorylase
MNEEHISHQLVFKNLQIDTNQELVVFMPANCLVCKSEGFQALTRVTVSTDIVSIVATLDITGNSLLNDGEISLSQSASRKLDCKNGSLLSVTHFQPLHSMEHVRSKIYGNSLDQVAFDEIIHDIVDEKYSNVFLSSFVTACSGNNMSREEVCFLTKAMINSGNKISWGKDIIADKHCVGGLPGNRTTLIVVPIIASLGITIPKTSSRAITSPAGTADTMEVLTNVNLNLQEIRNVVENENGCIAWGASIKLSPADDLIIRVERALDIDSESQMIASILSKKSAAGATHCVIDIPYGKTAKVRSIESAEKLAEDMKNVAAYIGLNIRTIISDGSQPIGYGIGPSLEARDVLLVLQNKDNAPKDLHDRAIKIAATIIQMVQNKSEEEAIRMAEQQILNGEAFNKLIKICEAQGRFTEPKYALHSKTIEAEFTGIVTDIDNRKIARLAKLAGAPESKEAGIDFQAHIGTQVSKGQPLFTIYANSEGELSYAYDYYKANEHHLIKISNE